MAYHMIMPIISYGHPVLTQAAAPLSDDYPDLPVLIQDMFDTMEAAGGIGLAAPQVGQSIQLFITGYPAGTDAFFKQNDRYPGRVFINPEIIATGGLMQGQTEGCLSIPGIEVSVLRPGHVRLRYQDHLFEHHEESFSGYMARVVQHEYDHLQGRLMTDRIHPHRQKSIRPFLRSIAKGKVSASYTMTHSES